MTRWRSGTFWASFLFGWVITLVGLAVFISIFGSEDMTQAEGWAANVAHQFLSLAAGYAYGRRQFEKQERKRKSRGFDVVPRG